MAEISTSDWNHDAAIPILPPKSRQRCSDIPGTVLRLSNRINDTRKVITMYASKLLASGLFAAAALVSHGASATIINSSDYVPGEQIILTPSHTDRAQVKAQARLAVIASLQPRKEFGAGSHDTSQSLRSRAEVKQEAASYVKASTKEFFTN